ncbi:MAG TPA: hypothetical protein VFF81_03080 [Noviherbaspirillum sp.]|nr:hypothetical protein [Noviherbaspirillum sp.]
MADNSLSHFVREHIQPVSTLCIGSGLIAAVLEYISVYLVAVFAGLLFLLMALIWSLDSRRDALTRWASDNTDFFSRIVRGLWCRGAPFYKSPLYVALAIVFLATSAYSISAIVAQREIDVSIDKLAAYRAERDKMYPTRPPLDEEIRAAIHASFVQSQRLGPECNLREYTEVSAYKVNGSWPETLSTYIYFPVVARHTFTLDWAEIARINATCASWDKEHRAPGVPHKALMESGLDHFPRMGEPYRGFSPHGSGVFSDEYASPGIFMRWENNKWLPQ